MKDARDLSPEEAVEALRCCTTPGGTCHQCPLFEMSELPDVDCSTCLMRHAADVLEELKREYDSMAKTVCEMSEYYRDRRHA